MSILAEYVAVVLLHSAERRGSEKLGGSAKRLSRTIRERHALDIDYQFISKAVALLQPFAAAENEYNPISDGYWEINYDNFRYYFINEKPDAADDAQFYSDQRRDALKFEVLCAFARRGIDYAEDVIDRLRELTSDEMQALDRTPTDARRDAPASDRIVTLDHNRPEYTDISLALEQAIALAEATRPNDISGDQHASIIAALRAANELWSGFEFSLMQLRVGVLLAIEQAQKHLKLNFEAARGGLLTEAIKTFVGGLFN